MNTHPVPVDIQSDELPLGQPLVDAEVGLAVEPVGDAGGEAGVGHGDAHPGEQPGQEHLALPALALPPAGPHTSALRWCDVTSGLRDVTGGLTLPGAGAGDGSPCQRVNTPAVALRPGAHSGHEHWIHWESYCQFSVRMSVRIRVL